MSSPASVSVPSSVRNASIESAMYPADSSHQKGRSVQGQQLARAGTSPFARPSRGPSRPSDSWAKRAPTEQLGRLSLLDLVRDLVLLLLDRKLVVSHQPDLTHSPASDRQPVRREMTGENGSGQLQQLASSAARRTRSKDAQVGSSEIKGEEGSAEPYGPQSTDRKGQGGSMQTTSARREGKKGGAKHAPLLLTVRDTSNVGRDHGDILVEALESWS